MMTTESFFVLDIPRYANVLVLPLTIVGVVGLKTLIEFAIEIIKP